MLARPASAFIAAVDRLSEWLSRVASAALAAACVIAVGAALAHFAYDVGSNAWLEIQWYLFAAVVMLGASATLRRNEHVRVDIVYAALSARGRLWVDIVGIAVFLLPTCALFFWWSWPVFVDAWVSGESSSNAGGLTRWPFKLMLPLGFGLLVLQGIAELAKRIQALCASTTADAPEYERPVQ